MGAFYAKKVLVVEDDAATAQMLVRRLESWGFRALAESTGAGAIETLSKHAVDLVILDVNLPDKSGLDVCVEMRQAKGPWLPILMLTGMDTSRDHLNGFGHGADAYLTKPYNSDELQQTIEVLTGSSSAVTRVAIPEKHFLSIEEVAKRFGVNVATVYRLAQRGRLPGFKIGSQWRFRSDALDAWIFTKSERKESA